MNAKVIAFPTRAERLLPDLTTKYPSLPAMVAVLKRNFSKLDEMDQTWLLRAEKVAEMGDEANHWLVIQYMEICRLMCANNNIGCGISQLEILPDPAA